MTSPGEWKGYVVTGTTKEQRRERLAEVPESLRDEVKRHVETFFAIKANARRAARGKRPIMRR
jgi:hypothetical protein